MPRPSLSSCPPFSAGPVPPPDGKQTLNAALRDAIEGMGMRYTGVHWQDSSTVEVWCLDGGNVRMFRATSDVNAFMARGSGWGSDFQDELYDKLMQQLHEYRGAALPA